MKKRSIRENLMTHQANIIVNAIGYGIGAIVGYILFNLIIHSNIYLFQVLEVFFYTFGLGVFANILVYSIFSRKK